jgi:nucleoside-diphosphate-sugar epimerase
MRVLVTGATGYLGRALVRGFHAAGHETVAFARHATSSGVPGACIDGDVRDAGAVSRATAGCQAICHSAALVSAWRRRRADFDEVNVGGLHNVVAAARTAGISRLVYTSTFLALAPGGEGQPGRWNDYQRTKVLADEAASRLVAEGAPLIRTYPGVIYGPGISSEGNLVGRMIADHLAGRLPGLVGASCVWSYSWIDDVAAAHVAAVERGEPGARYRLGGANAPQMRVYEIVRARTGRPLPFRIPAAAATLVGAVEELRATLTGRPPLLTVGAVEILTRNWPLDSDRAQHELGYRVTPLRDGIEKVLEQLPPLQAQSSGGSAA